MPQGARHFHDLHVIRRGGHGIQVTDGLETGSFVHIGVESLHYFDSLTPQKW
jgi:hypothetical protein